MNDSAHQILEAWQNYVVYKGCEKTKISANSIHENHSQHLVSTCLECTLWWLKRPSQKKCRVRFQIRKS